jgi:hypothetical protein
MNAYEGENNFAGRTGPHSNKINISPLVSNVNVPLPDGLGAG